MKIYKPRRDTVQRFEAARVKLTADLGRQPTTAEMAEQLGYSRQRVSQIATWLEAPLSTQTAGARVDLTQTIPPERDELETRLILNLRRIYALELQGAARSDGELGLAAGYKGRPDQAAAEFRKAFTGQRAPTVDICRKMARAFGVDPVEFWRPIVSATSEILSYARHWQARLANRGPIELTTDERAALLEFASATMETSPATTRMGKAWAVRDALGLSEYAAWDICESAGWPAGATR